VNRLLTVAEAAELFWLPEETLRTWMKRGQVPAPGPGLVWEMDVARAEAATRRKPRAERLAQLAKETT
jgi:hypothetical protein